MTHLFISRHLSGASKYVLLQSSIKMTTMKIVRIILTLIVFSAATALSFGQTTVKGVHWNQQNPSSLSIVDINPQTGSVIHSISQINLSQSSYVNNTLHHDMTNDLLFFQTRTITSQIMQGQKLMIARASSGSLLRTVDLTNSMAPFILSDKNQMGFIGTERESHGYGNNDDGIALVVFNLNTGKPSIRVELENLSFAAVPAPFVGQSVNTQGQKTTDEIALSSTVYMPKSQEILFSATDVLGVQRMFRINLASGKLVSSKAIDIRILDMAYNEATNDIQALYINTKEDGSMSLNIATLDINTYALTYAQELRTMSQSELPISDGSIKVGGNNVYVSKLNPANKQELYMLTLNDHQKVSMVVENNGSQLYDFEFPFVYSSAPATSILNLVELYPTPAVNTITIASLDKAKVTYVTIRNDIGQVVKEVKVESNLDQNQIDVSSLASGVYMVEIETDISTPINKKLIVQ